MEVTKKSQALQTSLNITENKTKIFQFGTGGNMVHSVCCNLLKIAKIVKYGLKKGNLNLLKPILSSV